MRVKDGELTWAGLRFESKTQLNQLFDLWCQKVFEFPRVTKRLDEAEAKKDVPCSRLLFLTRYHHDLELLMSRWSTESHTFLATWGEFTVLWRT